MVTTRKIQLLIVDDNLRFVERMIGMLEDVPGIGFINVASDFEEATKMLADELPDLVLLDINLPGKNGIELLKRIRQANNHCQVIMITNHADDYYRAQCEDLGANYFLDKSNDFAKVPAIIRKMGAGFSSFYTESNS